MKKGKRFGFTLAEVLITLGVIGVVAAITIPILVQNYQKTQYATAAKKFYTTFNQVLQQMAVDNGTVGSIADIVSSHYAFGDKIAPYFKIVKNCGYTNGDEECFAKFTDNYDGSADTTNRWNSSVSNGTAQPYYKFVTADGMSVAVEFGWESCNYKTGFPAVPDAPTNGHCGVALVDVNGTKKPNVLGRDVFDFRITSKKTPMLYPAGGFYHSYSDIGTAEGGGAGWWNYENADKCGSNVDKDGSFCAGRLMEKGWVMDY